MLTLSNSLMLADDGDIAVNLRNFYEREKAFVWSTKKWCEVEFDFDTSKLGRTEQCDLIMEMDVFKSGDALLGQNTLIYLNGLRIGSLFCDKRATYIFDFPANILKKTANRVTIDTPDACMPKEFGVADTRMLGVQLFSLQIRPGS